MAEWVELMHMPRPRRQALGPFEGREQTITQAVLSRSACRELMRAGRGRGKGRVETAARLEADRGTPNASAKIISIRASPMAERKIELSNAAPETGR